MSQQPDDGIVAPTVKSYTMANHGEHPSERRPSFAAVAGEIKLTYDKRLSQEKFDHLTEADKQERRDPALAKKNKAKSKKDNNDELKKELIMTEHTEEINSLLARLNTDASQGLKEDKYKDAYQKFGPNKMTPPPTTPEWVKFLKEISSGFALLLWAGGILCFISYGLQRNESDLYLGIVLCAVVLITGIFSYCQGRQSGALMESFKQMMADQATVIRGGKTFVTGADTLVPGDIILMKGGEKVPADVRIIECSDDMQVDNACLTGESEPCKRSTEAHHDNPLEADNLAFFGTQIPKGRATGLVIQTGDHTVMGRIAKLAVATETEQTPIARELAHFIMIISCVAITLGVIFFVVGLIIGTPIVSNLVFMIGIIVANVPEGLLATVTVCLTLTANRMYLKNVLVKNLEGVETLGSTTCICSDKTGTLTQNMMTVTNLMFDTYIYDCECSLYDKATTDKESNCFKKLMRCATICNKAKWDENSMLLHDEKGNIVYENGKEVRQPFIKEVKLGNVVEKKIQWIPIGDASENALIKYVQGFSGITDNIEDYRKEYPLIKEIPFNSTNKYQLSINKQSGKPNHLITMKGAPERILGRCNKYYDKEGNLHDLTPEKMSEIEKLQIELSKRGLRVLGFAELELDADKYKDDYAYKTDKPNFPLGECWENPDKINEQLYERDHCTTPLNFIGMTAMIDPPRPQVPGAVAKCKTAGIRVIMVTGDHPITAKAISKKVGIIWTETEDELVEINRKNGFYDEKNPKPRTAENGYREPALADAVVVPGSDFGVDTPDEVWNDILQHTQVVFARTSPQQKLLIVENCQKREEIVAVTGDGVNDAPALRKADIGVAMGIMGSAVSKDAADMILLDDNFASIVQGVEEGRLIFDNLKKSIAYTLSSNIPEIFPFLSFITVGIPLPLSTVTILCIDLGTDMVPAISLAWEEPESDIMRRPPRYAKTDHLVTGKLIFFAYLQIGMTQCMCAFLTYLIVMDDYGYPPKILMRAGANDNWGKQTLYCSFTGGVFRNINGDEYDDMHFIEYGKGNETVKHIHDAYQKGFWFYDPGHSQSDLDSCLFASRNYDSSNSKPEGYERFFNVSGYGNGYIQVTDTSVQALYNRGMVEYYPYRAARSTFWDQNWLKWDVEDTRVDGLGRDGKGPKDPVTYTYQPYGVYKVLSEKQSGKSSVEMKDSNDGITFGSSSINPDKCFSEAKLSFGEHTNLNEYIFPENTVKIGENKADIRLNVASRMSQKEALAHAQSAYFVSIVVVQWSDLLISKTRMNSIYEQGMRNSAMNFGIIFETWLGMMLCYIPPFNTAFGTRPLRLFHWCAPLPWFMFIILYDELRKFCMRKSVVMYEDKNTHQIFREPKWIERNTYY